ncbi:MAG TPA: HAD-IIIA family hydrolase [Nitrospiria bacterium]|nr:HAD-IIIA family hydrolase [Nitrospiria bacterium]
MAPISFKLGGGHGAPPRSLLNRARPIRLLLLDVDGVLTDGRIIYDADGRELKAFHIHDGFGINQLRASGCLVGFLSGRASAAVERRAKELDVTIVYQGVDDKLPVYERILSAHRLRDDEVAYVGDDLPDLPVLARAGLAVGVASAAPQVRRAVHWITSRAGGEGAVREVTDLLVLAGQLAPKRKRAV